MPALDQKVNMVGHEAEGVDGVAKLSPVAAQPCEIRLVVGLIEKSLLPLVAAHDDVIEQPWSKQSRSARHDRGL